MSFRKDLSDGEDAEKEFEAFLLACGYDTGRNTAKTVTEKRFYDMWAKEAPPEKLAKVKIRPVFTYEVKFDRRVKETGNVYFEHETLTNSRADYIVYKLDSTGKFYMQGREAVINLINQPQFKQVNGGDKWGVGTLIPETQFKQLFSEIEKVYNKVS